MYKVKIFDKKSPPPKGYKDNLINPNTLYMTEATRELHGLTKKSLRRNEI